MNLPAFHDAATGFDVAAFADAAATAGTALRLGEPDAPRYAIALADLDGLLAALGLDYDGAAAREVGAGVAALLRATADAALAGDQPDLLAAAHAWPVPERCAAVPGLVEAVRRARDAVPRGAGRLPSTAILPPGPADALLGVETGGIAPAFSAVGEDGGLTRAALARLTAAGLSPGAALAGQLGGAPVLMPASLAAHQAMHDAVAPYLHAMPPRPTAQATLAARLHAEGLGRRPPPLPSHRRIR